MSRKEKYALLAALMKRLQQSGSWCGETHIQKAVYLAQELLKVPFGYDFRLYKHGPYSFDLRDELASMRADEALCVRAQAYPYGPTLEPTERGEKLIGERSDLIKAYDGSLAFVAGWFNSKDVKQLERLATGYLVTNKMRAGSTPQERAERLHELKPHIPLQSAADAIHQVDKFVAEWNEVRPV